MSEQLTGKIYSFTEVQRDNAPAGFVGLAPYFVALVQIDRGPMVTAQLTDLHLDLATGAWKPPAIGDPVEMVTHKLKDDGDERGLIVYGYKFRPVIRE